MGRLMKRLAVVYLAAFSAVGLHVTTEASGTGATASTLVGDEVEAAARSLRDPRDRRPIRALDRDPR